MNDGDFLDAIEFGSLAEAKVYSGDGKDIEVNLQDHRGMTPIVVASYYGHNDIVEWLLGLNADPNIPDQSGKNAIDHAKEQGHEECLTLLARIT